MVTGRASVLFVMPPGGVIPHFSEHLGTAFLRAVLEAAGISSRQYLPGRGVTLGTFSGFLHDQRPSIVGLTAYETNLRACRAMVRTVRETLPETVVMVGGPNATFSPEETLDLLEADLCVRGAAEGTIVAIAQAILEAPGARGRLPELLAGVRSLVLRTPDGTTSTPVGDLSSFPGEYFRSLDDIPSPYQAGLIATADVGFLTSRGCNQHCTYCSFAAISGRKVHHHGIERVLDDLEAFKPVAERAAPLRRSITIYDDAFSLTPQRARAICEGIIRRGLQMPFDCETRADRVDLDLLRLMKQAGFVGVSFGLESAVPRVLRTIGKVQSPDTGDDPEFDAERQFLERLRGAVAAAKEAGLATSVSVIGGLPGETPADFRTTLEFVESLGVSSYAHNVLTVLPGTPLHRERERHGLKVSRQAHSGQWRTHHTYDVLSVPPLGNSFLHLERWEEAHQISDALCGRPRPAGADDSGVWAVIIHAAEPDQRLAAWLPEVLAVNGTVVVVSRRPGLDPLALGEWLRALSEAGFPWGLAAALSPETEPDGALVLRSTGTLGAHRFVVEPAFRLDGCAVEADRAGHCRVPMWIASGSEHPPAGQEADALLAPAPQVADGCRWWAGWRRCRQPRVLHVRPDLTVGPCWNGPAIGTVGDTFIALATRGRELARAADGSRDPAGNACPMGAAGEQGASAARVAQRYDVGAQLSWRFPQSDSKQQEPA